MQMPNPRIIKIAPKDGLLKLKTRFDLYVEKHPERDSELVMIRATPDNGKNSAEGVAGHLVGKINTKSLSERLLKGFERDGLVVTPYNEKGDSYIYRPIRGKAEISLYEKVEAARRKKMGEIVEAVRKDYPKKPTRSQENRERMIQ